MFHLPMPPKEKRESYKWKDVAIVLDKRHILVVASKELARSSNETTAISS